MEVTVYLSLGTNLGDKIKNLHQAYSLIEERCGKVQLKSKIYRTPPVGFDSENDFLNSCISITTNLSPQELLVATQGIERTIGRKIKSGSNYSDRIIDIDILFYDDLIISAETLQIPHAKYRDRMFVLQPLNDIANTFIDPVTNQAIQTLVDKCIDKTTISIYQ